MKLWSASTNEVLVGYRSQDVIIEISKVSGFFHKCGSSVFTGQVAKTVCFFFFQTLSPLGSRVRVFKENSIDQLPILSGHLMNKNTSWWENMKTTSFLSIMSFYCGRPLWKANEWKLTCRKAIAPQCKFKSLTPTIPRCVSGVITRQHAGQCGQCCPGLGGLANCLLYVCLSAPQINVA